MTPMMGTGSELLKDVTAWTGTSTMNLNDFKYNTWMNQSGSVGLKLGSLPDHEIVLLQIVQLERFPDTDAVKTKQKYTLPFANE